MTAYYAISNRLNMFWLYVVPVSILKTHEPSVNKKFLKDKHNPQNRPITAHQTNNKFSHSSAFPFFNHENIFSIRNFWWNALNVGKT